MGLLDHAMPLAGFAGGLMIGLAAAVMLLGDGRIAGVSGLLARASFTGVTSTPYAIAFAFIAGLPLGAWLVAVVAGPVVVRFPASAVTLITGGLLVGFGTRLGSGCTSGHGVCGMSRLSIRSLIATASFILVGILTVLVMNFFAGVA